MRRRMKLDVGSLKEIAAVRRQRAQTDGDVATGFGLQLDYADDDDPLSQQGKSGAQSAVSSATNSGNTWRERKDPRSGRAYYWNVATRQVSWELPQDAVLENTTTSPANAQPNISVTPIASSTFVTVPVSSSPSLQSATAPSDPLHASPKAVSALSTPASSGSSTITPVHNRTISASRIAEKLLERLLTKIEEELHDNPTVKRRRVEEEVLPVSSSASSSSASPSVSNSSSLPKSTTECASVAITEEAVVADTVAQSHHISELKRQLEREQRQKERLLGEGVEASADELMGAATAILQEVQFLGNITATWDKHEQRRLSSDTAQPTGVDAHNRTLATIFESAYKLHARQKMNEMVEALADVRASLSAAVTQHQEQNTALSVARERGRTSNRTKTAAVKVAPRKSSKKVGKLDSLIAKWKRKEKEMAGTCAEHEEEDDEYALQKWYAEQLQNGAAVNNANFTPLGRR